MTWHVGAIVNEPQAEVLRFAAWYFDAGAHGMTLLFDNPDDPTAAIFDEHPDVTVVRCTPSFWERLGLSKDVRFARRQNLALSWLYRQSPADWLLNVDADEFMYIPGQSVDEFLSNQPEDIEAVRVPTAESLLTGEEEAEGHYRLPMTREAAGRVYQDDARFFGTSRMGLVGHAWGKSFVRCGVEDISLRQHWAQSREGREIKERVIEVSTGAALLHHIGSSYDIWRNKVDWRVGSRGFTDSLSEVVTSALGSPNCEEQLKMVHTALHGCDDDRLERLKAEKAHFEIPYSRCPDAIARDILGDAV